MIDFLLVCALLLYSAWAGLPFVDVVPFALILLVASVPVALPATFTLATALGATELAHNGVLVTRLSAIEEAAGMDVLCTDKTGTITENRLALAATFPFGEISEDDVLRAAALACDPSTQDPIDLAILSAAAACGLHEKRERLEFLPFDPAHRYSLGRYQSSSGEEYMIKGAPRAVAALTQNTPDFAAKSEQFAAAGNRVLGVASGKSRNNLQLVGYSHSKIRRGPIPNSWSQVFRTSAFKSSWLVETMSRPLPPSPSGSVLAAGLLPPRSSMV